jgi:hypothetical protein
MYPGSDDAGDATEGQAKFEFLTLKLGHRLLLWGRADEEQRPSPSCLG